MFHATYVTYYVTNSSHVIGQFLRCLLQIRTCSISLTRRVLDLPLLALRMLRTLRTLRALRVQGWKPGFSLHTYPIRLSAIYSRYVIRSLLYL